MPSHSVSAVVLGPSYPPCADCGDTEKTNYYERDGEWACDEVADCRERQFDAAMTENARFRVDAAEWRTVLAELGVTFEAVADGWKVNTPGRGISVWDTTPLDAWNHWKKVNRGH